jgi:glycosyltransferase involved in cell wall biosynthesis
LHLYRNETNKKIVETLNFALQQSNGDFIARMDGDDVTSKDRIEKQWQYLMNNRSIDLVGVGYHLIDEQGKHLRNEKFLSDYDKIVDATKFVSPIAHVWMARRKVYDIVGLYRIPTAEDYDFILRAIDKGFKISNIPEILYSTRIRNGNTQTTAGLLQKKSFHYARKMKKERESNRDGLDSFSYENLRLQLKAGWFEKKSFAIANYFNQKFILTKRKSSASAILFLIMTLIFSPKYLLREKYFRFRYKRMLQ